MARQRISDIIAKDELPSLTGKLTAAKVKAMSTPGVIADGGNLYLRVVKNASGTITKGWIFRYMLHGKSHNMGFGSVNDVTLAQARADAMDCRGLARKGIDPISTYRAAVIANATSSVTEVPTFSEAAEEYIRAKEAGWRDRLEGANWRSTFDTYAQLLMPLPVDEIDTQLVLRVIEPLWTTRYKLAKKLQTRIEAVLAAATVKGYRQGDNPAQWRGYLDKAGLSAPEAAKAVQARKALPYDDVPKLVGELRAMNEVKARAVEFLILTAARAGEVVYGERSAGMKWSEVDFSTATWTIPAARMKGGVQHRVPLSDRAVEILREMEAVRTDDRVFAVGYVTIKRQLQALRSGVDVHGFRSSFRDWCLVNRIDHDVAEKSLAHYEGSRTVKAYARDDLLELRRPVMAAWARFCCGETTDNVVELKKRA